MVIVYFQEDNSFTMQIQYINKFTHVLTSAQHLHEIDQIHTFSS